MKNLLKKLQLSLILSFTSLVAFGLEIDFTPIKEKYNKNIVSFTQKLKESQELYDKNLKEIAKLKSESHKLDSYIKNYDQLKSKMLKWLSREINEKKGLKKLFRKTYVNTLHCIKNRIQSSSSSPPFAKSCIKLFRPNLKNDEEQSLINLDKQFIKTLSSASSDLEYFLKRLDRLENQNQQIKLNIDDYAQSLAKTKKEWEYEERVFKEIKNLRDITCKSFQRNYLDLEEGNAKQRSQNTPFWGIPRDHQNAVGTCYANAAKNLLLSISKGQDNASFLDLALVYKRESSLQGFAKGLDGGLTCEILNTIKEVGYCPKIYSPIESGDKPKTSIPHLINTPKSLYNQAIIFQAIGDFQRAQSHLERLNATSLIIKNPLKFFKKFRIEKNKKNLRFPIPYLEDSYIDINILGAYWERTYFSRLSDQFRSQYIEDIHSKIKAELSFQKFWYDFILKIYKPKLEEEKIKFNYNLKSKLQESYVKNYNKHINSNYWHKVYKNSYDFLINYLDETAEGNEKKELIKNCNVQQATNTYLESLHKIDNFFDWGDFQDDTLFEKDGNFKKINDLMQLATAPECIDTNKRKKPSQDFYCKRHEDFKSDMKMLSSDKNTQFAIFEKRVIASLRQGIALGNTHLTTGGYHINTIVGLRFYNNQCQLKIRESQTGQSYWSSSQNIYNQLLTLVELRRE